MKVMVLVKATQDSEAGVMPSEQLLTWGNITKRWSRQEFYSLRGQAQRGACKVLRNPSNRNGWTVHRDKELVAGFWIWQVKSMEEAITCQTLPEPNARRIRDRDSSDLYRRRFRRSVDARTQRRKNASVQRLTNSRVRECISITQNQVLTLEPYLSRMLITCYRGQPQDLSHHIVLWFYYS